MEGHIGTYCQIWEQNLIVWTSSAVPPATPPLSRLPLFYCNTAKSEYPQKHSVHGGSVMTLLGKYAPETIIKLISSNYFLRILRIVSHKNLEIVIFLLCEAQELHNAHSTVCVLVGLGRGTRRCRSISH